MLILSYKATGSLSFYLHSNIYINLGNLKDNTGNTSINMTSHFFLGLFMSLFNPIHTQNSEPFIPLICSASKSTDSGILLYYIKQISFPITVNLMISLESPPVIFLPSTLVIFLLLIYLPTLYNNYFRSSLLFNYFPPPNSFFINRYESASSHKEKRKFSTLMPHLILFLHI